jgi:hypothetical protein
MQGSTNLVADPKRDFRSGILRARAAGLSSAAKTESVAREGGDAA